jgi:hypothetical protein
MANPISQSARWLFYSLLAGDLSALGEPRPARDLDEQALAMRQRLARRRSVLGGCRWLIEKGVPHATKSGGRPSQERSEESGGAASGHSAGHSATHHTTQQGRSSWTAHPT